MSKQITVPLILTLTFTSFYLFLIQIAYDHHFIGIDTSSVFSITIAMISFYIVLITFFSYEMKHGIKDKYLHIPLTLSFIILFSISVSLEEDLRTKEFSFLSVKKYAYSMNKFDYTLNLYTYINNTNFTKTFSSKADLDKVLNKLSSNDIKILVYKKNGIFGKEFKIFTQSEKDELDLKRWVNYKNNS